MAGSDPPGPFASVHAFAEPERWLTAYFRSSTFGLCICDTQFRFLAINDVLARRSGLHPKEHIGKTVRQALGDSASALEAGLQHVISTSEPVLNVDPADLFASEAGIGQWICHLFPIENEKGQVIRVGAVVMEVAKKLAETPKTQVDANLRKELARLQALVDVSGILSANWEVLQVFPTISARIRRLLQHEYAGFSSHDLENRVPVQQIEDFPLGKRLGSTMEMTAPDGPAGRSLRAGSTMTFSRNELQGFDAEIAQRLVEEGMESLCCVPLVRPQGVLGVLILGSTRRNAFHSQDVELLEQVGGLLAVAMENQRAAAEIKALKQRIAEESRYLDGEIHALGEFAEIIGESAVLKQVLEQVATVAGSEATVLILGETGTGKELVARAIHRMSGRKNKAMIKVNCAAIPTGLLESELFGHEKGAFTGAISQKIGRLELADGGTLFLDEIGEISLELQPKLLRVLQDREFERLGSTRTIRVDVRVIAATNRDLAENVAEHKFRGDLYYRLNVFPISIPPLRERREDIPLLVRYFVQKFAGQMNRHVERITKPTIDALEAWNWPGNIRELENLMERSVILSSGRTLHVPLKDLVTPAPNPEHQDDSLEGAEREHIIRILRETGGIVSGGNGAAVRLGLKRTTLQSKMRRLKIRREDYSSES